MTPSVGDGMARSNASYRDFTGHRSALPDSSAHEYLPGGIGTPAGHRRQYDDGVTSSRKSIYIDSNNRRSTLPLLPPRSDTFTRVDFSDNKAFKKIPFSRTHVEARERESDYQRILGPLITNIGRPG